MTNLSFAPPTDATAQGFATFNEVPTLCVEIPDGNSTVSFKLSDGRRLTVAFLPYADGGVPQCADICYHDNGTTGLTPNKTRVPTFDVIAFGGGKTVVDTRTAGPAARPSILTVLMPEPSE